MHCYFLLTGDNTCPVTITVQRARDGNSFVTRTVSASQKENCIFTCTLSFVRPGAGGHKTVHHSPTIPDWIQPPAEDEPGMVSNAQYNPQEVAIGIENCNDKPEAKKLRSWFRAPNKIAKTDDSCTHQVILAFMSDWNMISSIPYIHELWEYPPLAPSTPDDSRLDGTVVSMLTSLDHTIFFHAPLEIRADEWMFLEVECPWTGAGRGLVTGKIFTKDGTYVATCIQEVGHSTYVFKSLTNLIQGVVRLRQGLIKHNAKM